MKKTIVYILIGLLLITSVNAIGIESVSSAWDFDYTTEDIHDGDANATDGSGTYVNGVLGQAYGMDGSNDFLNFSDAEEFDGTWSVSMWIYHNTSDSLEVVMNKKFIWDVAINTDDTIRFYPGTGVGWFGTAPYTSTNTLSTGAWHHVVMSHIDSENRISLWIDGVQENVSTGSDTVTQNDEEFLLGRDQGATRFNGSIDEMIYFNKELNESEVLDLYNTGNGTSYPFDKPTTYYLKFNETRENEIHIVTLTEDNGCYGEPTIALWDGGTEVDIATHNNTYRKFAFVTTGAVNYTLTCDGSGEGANWQTIMHWIDCDGSSQDNNDWNWDDTGVTNCNSGSAYSGNSLDINAGTNGEEGWISLRNRITSGNVSATGMIRYDDTTIDYSMTVLADTINNIYDNASSLYETNAVGASAGTDVKCEVTMTYSSELKWYVTANDTWDLTTSGTYNYTTYANSEPTSTFHGPTNNTQFTIGYRVLNITYNDVDSDIGTIYFYNSSNNEILCTNNSINTGTLVGCGVNLTYSQELKWYYNITNDYHNVKSGIYNYSTEAEPPVLPDKWVFNITDTNQIGWYNITRVWANASDGKENNTYPYIAFEVTSVGGSDPCEYTSGDWTLNVSDYCNITTNTDIGSNKLIFVGETGKISIQANITTKEVHYQPDAFSGTYIIENNGSINIEP